MTAKYRSTGDTITFVAAAAYSRGDVVVVGSVVGVVQNDDPAIGDDVTLAICGEHEFPKATDTGSALTQGELVYWDADPGVITATSSGNTKAGYVSVAAAADDATVMVIIER